MNRQIFCYFYKLLTGFCPNIFQKREKKIKNKLSQTLMIISRVKNRNWNFDFSLKKKKKKKVSLQLSETVSRRDCMPSTVNVELKSRTVSRMT